MAGQSGQGVRVARLLPGAVIAVAVVLLLAVTGVSVADGVRYSVALGLTVLAPGMLVHRVARGRPGTLVEDLALGFCTGVALQMVAWAVFTAVGIQQVLGLWPVLVIVPVALVPRFRDVWTLRPYDRVLHPATSWLLASATLIGLAGWIRTAASSDLPPTKWYPDTYWHLGAVAELMRTVVPQVPQVAGPDFKYHWFANAHMAAMTSSSGVDPQIVIARLWAVPIVLALIGMIVAACVAITRTAWPAGFAALLVVSEAETLPASWYRMPGAETMGFLSPSQVFALPLLLFATIAVLPLLRGHPLRRGGWLVAVLAVGVLGGAKSSALPVLLCGALLATVVTVVQRQNWRRPLLAVGLVAAGLVGVTLPLSSAGGAGAGIQLFAILGVTKPWLIEFGWPPLAAYRDPILPGMLEPAGLALVGLLLIGFAIAYAWLVIAIGPLLRGCPVAWFLFGSGFAGLCAMLLLNHDGLSQVYFMRGAVICWYLLAALSLGPICKRAFARFGNLVTTGTLLLGAAVGAAVVLVAQIAGGVPERGQVAGSMIVGFVVFTMGTVVTIGGALLLSRRARVLRGPVLAGAAMGAAVLPSVIPRLVGDAGMGPAWQLGALVPVLLCGAALIWGTAQLPQRVSAVALCVALAIPGALAGGTAALNFWPLTDRMLSEARAPLNGAELRATAWLASSTDADALVATNVHCLQKRTLPGCDARAFWVSGLGQRRVLIEGWAYTEAAHAAHGINGQSSRTAPFHDPDLYGLNERAFTAPTPDVLAQLKSRGVRYLFADTAAGPVAVARLRQLTIERFSDDGVHIFELR